MEDVRTHSAAAAPSHAAAAAAAGPLQRALPLLLAPSAAPAALIDAWQRSVLPAPPASSALLRRCGVFASSVCVFAALLACSHRLAGGWRRDSPFGRRWLGWSAVQRLEWSSYAVSTVHAVAACVVGALAIADSLVALHRSHSAAADGSLWAAAVWFARTSAHRLLPAPAASAATASSHVAAFELALSCAFSESAWRESALLLTAGYLLVDLALCIASTRYRQRAAAGERRVQLAQPLTLAHHALILAAFAWCVSSGTGSLYCVCLLLNEASTPFLNLNYQLAALHLSAVHARLYTCNAALLLALFVSVRVLLNGALLAHLFAFSWLELRPLWRDGDAFVMPLDVRVRCAALSALCCGHVLINCIWAVQMAAAVQRKCGRAAAAICREQNDSGGGGRKSKQL